MSVIDKGLDVEMLKSGSLINLNSFFVCLKFFDSLHHPGKVTATGLV